MALLRSVRVPVSLDLFFDSKFRVNNGAAHRLLTNTEPDDVDIATGSWYQHRLALAPAPGLGQHDSVIMCGQGLQTRSFAYTSNHPEDIPADFPNPEKVFILKDDFQSRNGHFLRLFDCDGIRYSLLLSFNEEVCECLENEYLEKMYSAFEEEDLEDHRNSLHLAAAAFMKLFWPYLHEDFKLRSTNGSLMKAVSPVDFESKDCHKLQLRTVDGSMCAIEHDVVPDFGCCNFTNPYPDLRCVPANNIEHIEKASFLVYRVRFEGEEYALKAARMEAMEAVKKLHGAPQHPNVLGLSGVTVNVEGKIVGLLTPFIYGKDLASISSATTSEKTSWKAKITDAVKFLHKQNIVWGDAKPDNIMISEDTNEPVLLDFEGGYTPGWVDRELCNTIEGDLQALPRILKAIDDIANVNV